MPRCVVSGQDGRVARSAESLHLQAVDQTNRGRLAEAQRLLVRAAERTDEPDLEARIAGTRALILARVGKTDLADQMCAEAYGRSDISAQTRAVLAGQIGVIAEISGRLARADQWLTRAIDRLEDPGARANLLLNRGMLHMQRRRFDDAARDTQSAAETYALQRRLIDEAEARHNLGYIEFLRGDLVRAMQEMAQARPALQGISAVTEAVITVDRAVVLRDAGLTREAEESMAAAAATYGAHRMAKDRADTELDLARSQLTHDPLAAGRTAAAAERRFGAVGDDTGASRAAALRVRANLSSGTLIRGGESIPEPRRQPDLVEPQRIAVALESNGFHSEAAALRLTENLYRSRRGLPSSVRGMRAPANASMDVRLLAYEARAARATARGRHAEARRHAAAGIDALTDGQHSFGSLELQASLPMHAQGLMIAGLTSAVHSRRPDVVFEWSERARHLQQRVVPLRPSPDPELAADLAELRMMRADDPAWLSDPRAAALRERARERQWTATRAAAIQHHATLDELRAGLDPQTAYVTFVVSAEALSVLVVTQDVDALFPIPQWRALRDALPALRADLTVCASLSRGPMSAVVRRALDDRLAGLSAGLLGRASAVIGDRRVVLTAPGLLAGIPWTMLPALADRPVTLAVSATRWLSFRETATAPLGTAGFVAGPRVPRAAEEVAVAARAWTASELKTEILGREDATVAAVTRLASDVDVLHIAAHGRHAAENPLFSGLELHDGPLFGYDLDQMTTVPRVVILSACEVGRSSVLWGEESLGMTRAWLHAGAQCVVAAPVVVADDAACELLADLHAGLTEGRTPAEALAEASARTAISAPFQTHGAGF